MSASQGSPTHVFLGGVVGFDDIATPANTALLRQAGDAGLYMHADAMAAAYAAGQLPAIAQAMAGTGPGEIELGLNDVAAGFFAGWWKSVCVDNGLHPDRANVNADFDDPNFLKDWYAYVDAARAVGIATLAPVFSPNGANSSLADFATNPAYADIRTAALYGGALCIDAPPIYFLQRGPEYQTFIEQELRWAATNGLRSTVIIAPYGDDTTLLADTQTFVGTLVGSGAVPTEWVVENYNPGDTDGVGSDTQANSIAGVALWVALNAAVSPQPASAPAAATSTGTAPVSVPVIAPAAPEASPAAAATPVAPGTSTAPVSVPVVASAGPDTSPAATATQTAPVANPATSAAIVTDLGGHGSITAGLGNSTIYSRGTDTVTAGDGLDVVYASGPATQVTAGSGTLVFIGGAGTASVEGGTGTSILYGGSGGGVLGAGAGGHSILVAGSGNTTLVGAADGDMLFATPSADGNTLQAGAGQEILVAGAGATTLAGGSGSSIQFAGTGADSFRLWAGSSEEIVEFKTTDRIVSGDGTAPVVIARQQGGWGTTLLLADGTKVVLFNSLIPG